MPSSHFSITQTMIMYICMYSVHCTQQHCFDFLKKYTLEGFEPGILFLRRMRCRLRLAAMAIPFIPLPLCTWVLSFYPYFVHHWFIVLSLPLLGPLFVSRVARLFLVEITKTGKMYKICHINTKLPYIRPKFPNYTNGHEIYQKFPFEIDIFGMCTNKPSGNPVSHDA
jgi:hypothetical protein